MKTLFSFAAFMAVAVTFFAFLNYIVQKKRSYVPIILFCLILVSPLIPIGLPFKKYVRLNEVFIITIMLFCFAGNVVKGKKIGLRRIEALLLLTGCSLSFSIFHGYLFLDVIPTPLDFNQVYNIIMFCLYLRIGSFFDHKSIDIGIVKKLLFVSILLFNSITIIFFIPWGIENVVPYYLPELVLERSELISSTWVPPRIMGIVGSANTSAILSVIVILLIMAWIIYMPEKNKFYITILLFFSIVNLILMFSRNALVSLILAAAFLLRTVKFNKVIMKLLLSIIILIVFASFISLEQLFGPAYTYVRGFRLLEAFQGSDVSESVFSGRVYHWQMGFLKSILSPVFGWGPSIGDNMLNESLGLTETIRGFYAPHNEYIDMLLTTGIIGFAIYLLFFITIYKKASMLSRNKTDCFSMYLGRSVQAIIIALAVFNLSDGCWHNAFVPTILMLIFGAMYAGDKKQKLLSNKMQTIYGK